MTRGVAELHPAAVWDCDECGVENYVRQIKHDMSGDDREWVKEKFGFTEFELQEKEFYQMPLVITCRQCGTQFDSVDIEDAE